MAQRSYGSSKSSTRGNRRHSKLPRQLLKSDDEPTPRLRSRASPAPKDDFDDDVFEEANDYAAERHNEAERMETRLQNAQRKKEGKSVLKMPPKFKREKHPSKSGLVSHKRRRGSDSDEFSGESIVDARVFVYEGQRRLGFDPLPILAQLRQEEFHPDNIIQQMTGNGGSMAIEDTEMQLELPLELQGTTCRTALASAESTMCITPDQACGISAPGISSFDTEPEIKPAVQGDIKTVTPSSIKPYVQSDVVKLEPDVDRKPNLSTILDEVDEEEEDYGDDDIVVIPQQVNPLLASSKLEDEKPDVKPELGVKSELFDSYETEEEDEIYPDDDDVFFDSLRNSVLTTQYQSLSEQLPGLDPKALETAIERPGFPCTDEQRLIEPYEVDPDDRSIVIPACINRFLRPYQRSGVLFLHDKYKKGLGGILGDDMGLGKTVQVISFLSAIMRKTGTAVDGGRRKAQIRKAGEKMSPQRWATALLVCPTSLIPNWARELDTWGYFEYEIWTSKTTADTLKSMAGGYLDIDLFIRAADDLKKLPFSVVILDEAHRMKNPKGRLSLAIKKIPCRSCFGLTGTLIQNRMDEMWSVMDFCQRGWAGTLREWRNYVVNPINRGHRHDGKIAEVVTSIVYDGILPHFYIRRDKSKIANELPQKRDMVVLCPLAEHQDAVYRRIIESDDVAFILRAKEPCDCKSGEKRVDCCYLTNSVGDDVRTAILKMFDALGRVANHMALLYSNNDDLPRQQDVNRRVFEFCTGQVYDPRQHNRLEAELDQRNCGKWTLLQNMLLEWRSKPEEQNKVLLFSNSVRLLKYIEDFINLSNDLNFEFGVFTGEVDKAQRMEIVDNFQDPNKDMFLMLVSTMAGGVGLNLTAANKVIIFDPNWNPANDLQAMDRAFRFGQKRNVEVYRFVSQGTIEEVMYERQIYKQQRSRQLNDGTFERRTHKGFEGATSKVDKGDLFGVHNIFRYDPKGYVKGNLERVRMTEDQLQQDIFEQALVSESEDDDEDEAGKEMRRHRMKKEAKKAELEEAHQTDSLMNEIMSDGGALSSKPVNQDQLLSKLGVSALDHNDAFRDSPHERKIYERGLQLMLEMPEMGDMLANEIGKVRLPSERQVKRVRKEKVKVVEEGERAPWQSRLQTRKMKSRPVRKLVDLDDD